MPAPRTRANAQKKGPAEVAPSKPSQNPNNPCEEKAVSEQQLTPAPADPATINFQDAFESMEDGLLVLERRFHTVDFIVNGIAGLIDKDANGFTRIDESSADALWSTCVDTREALDAIMQHWRATHNAHCSQEITAFIANTARDRSPTSIADLFSVWLAIRNCATKGRPKAEVEASNVLYLQFRDRILEVEPKTPRDVAMQFYADTDGTESEFSADFSRRMKAMALEGRAA